MIFEKDIKGAFLVHFPMKLPLAVSSWNRTNHGGLVFLDSLGSGCFSVLRFGFLWHGASRRHSASSVWGQGIIQLSQCTAKETQQCWWLYRKCTLESQSVIKTGHSHNFTSGSEPEGAELWLEHYSLCTLPSSADSFCRSARCLFCPAGTQVCIHKPVLSCRRLSTKVLFGGGSSWRQSSLWSEEAEKERPWYN